MNDFYTPAPAPSTYYGYMSGNTYMIDGYRMYLQGGYWYFVDFPTAPPRRASRQHYRTGGTAGTLLKVFGVLSFLAGICLMFGDGIGFLLPGAVLVSFGIFGTAMALYDSTRNHPTAWKVGATAAVVTYAVHSLTDDDH